MRTSNTVCPAPGAQNTRGLSQLYGTSAPSAGSERHGPPVVVPVAPSPAKSVATLAGGGVAAVVSTTGAAGKSAQAPPSHPALPSRPPLGGGGARLSSELTASKPPPKASVDASLPKSLFPPLPPAAQLTARAEAGASASAISEAYFTRDDRERCSMRNLQPGQREGYEGLPRGRGPIGQT